MSQDDEVNPKVHKDNVYNRVGGLIFFTDLVEKFYNIVENDPLLRPMYPQNLNPGKEHLAGFLAQYWGGPMEYTQMRGHPRLRMRHSPFTIGKKERDRWVSHMLSALDNMEILTEDKELIIEYFENTATLLINNWSE